MYAVTQSLCAEAGFPNYEVSNHARPGAESRHNLIYWRYGDYAGVGPGAHGRITINGQRFATECERMPGAWLQAVSQGTAETVRDPIARQDQALEYLLMGLRVRGGIDTERYAALAGKPLPRSATEHLTEIGMITVTEGNIAVTNQGLIVLNSVIEKLATG